MHSEHLLKLRSSASVGSSALYACLTEHPDLCRWVSLNKAATQIAAGLPSGAAALNATYSNTVTKLFQSAVSAKFTAVRLFLHGEDEGSQLQTQPGQSPPPALLSQEGLHASPQCSPSTACMTAVGSDTDANRHWHAGVYNEAVFK